MKKKCFLLGCAFAITLGATAQTLIKLVDEKAVALSGISKNGRYSFGIPEGGGGVFFYDLAKNKLNFYEGAYADDVSNDGMLVGALGPNAQYCINGQWHDLPLPNDPKLSENEARGVSANGEIIVGEMSYASGPRKPCLWTRQPDGSYKIEYLPTIEKDLTGRRPQAVDAVRCSASGDIIYGRMIDCSGMFNMPVYWKKNSENKWACQLAGKEIMFKEGKEIPQIPDFEKPSGTAYFTHEDSVTFQKVVDDWEKNPVGPNPKWQDTSKYITNPDSIARYQADLAEFKRINVIIQQKTEEFYTVTTGITFDLFSPVFSNNGRFIGTTCTEILADEEVTPGGDPLIGESEKADKYPAFYDITTGKWELVKEAKDAALMGVSDNGDLFYSTPNMDAAFRSSFVIPANTKKSTTISDWVLEQTKGAIKLAEDTDLIFDFSEVKGPGAENTLMTGTVMPSGDGKVIMSYLYSINRDNYLTYFVDINSTYASSVENLKTESNDITIYPNPVSDILYIHGNAQAVNIVDLAGRSVYQSSVVSGSIPVSSFAAGTYLVKVTAAGKTTTKKIWVTK